MKARSLPRHCRTMITCTDEGSLSFWPEGQVKVYTIVYVTLVSCLMRAEGIVV